MVLQARQRLSDDHQTIGEVLKQVLMALEKKDVQTSYSKLDLLWARLAVHIRAEHVDLFPAVTNGLRKSSDGVGADLSEALALVETLRADHDFFMHELARGIGILRELPHRTVSTRSEAKLAAVGEVVREVEKRLATHNEIEENQIYRWASVILTQSEQMILLSRINTQLENRPPRFSEEAWANG